MVGRKFKACKIGDMLGFLVVVGGYLKKYLSVLSLCFIVLVGVLFKLALSMSD
ncbi:membrane protein [Helicobacter pylori PZ5024]|uniref:Membrane protein n=1 Tax=Helicobacter pylori PZ5024 TaxID=1337391 RepID=T2SU16_HELPX|nr:membrane protein [Helicobacter pylori PZ5024]